MTTTSVSIAQGITAQFIHEKPTSIVISRRPRVLQPTGGWKFGAGVDMPKQTIRIQPGSVVATRPTVRTISDGRQVSPSHIVVARLDADIERWDLFELDDFIYEVVSVVEKVLFQRRIAEVWRHGG